LKNTNKEYNESIPTAQDLRKLSELAKPELDKANVLECVKFFVSIAESAAKNGKLHKDTSCLLRRKDGYYCQTGNDGSGFDLFDIDSVIKELESLGFTINFRFKVSGYSSLRLEW